MGISSPYGRHGKYVSCEICYGCVCPPQSSIVRAYHTYTYIHSRFKITFGVTVCAEPSRVSIEFLSEYMRLDFSG